MGYNSPRREKLMLIDPTPALKREVHQLVDLQIQTLRQPSSLTTTQLQDYKQRSQRIRLLYGELDRMGRARLGRARLGLPLARAS